MNVRGHLWCLLKTTGHNDNLHLEVPTHISSCRHFTYLSSPRHWPTGVAHQPGHLSGEAVPSVHGQCLPRGGSLLCRKKAEPKYKNSSRQKEAELVSVTFWRISAWFKLSRLYCYLEHIIFFQTNSFDLGSDPHAWDVSQLQI